MVDILGFASPPSARSGRRRVSSASSAARNSAAGKRGPTRSRQIQKDPKDKQVAVALEEKFLASMEQGLGGGIDSLALADGVATLRRWPPGEQRRLLTGDWRLRASDGGDIFVQLGSGLHGLPFMEVGTFFISLRTSSKLVRSVEILKDMGPMKRVTTMLKGTMECNQDSGLSVEYTGMVDKDGATTKQERMGETRKLATTLYFVGEKALVLHVEPTGDRKGGFAVFERLDDLASALREATGTTCAVLPGR